MGVPVFYLVAPQVWAWRQGRVRQIRERVRKLFCLFPFEEEWFRSRGVDATYIGHPLATAVKPTSTRDAFFASHGLDAGTLTIAVLPGSRAGEAQRHMPDLLGALKILRQRFPLQIVLATPNGFAEQRVFATFREPIRELAIKVIEDETWDVLANADLALAASGTVTVEAAVLGTPMVTYYKVTSASWWAGRRLVKVPYLSMVNLIAGRMAVPELIQHEMTPDKLADAASPLLVDPENAARMRRDLAIIKAKLTAQFDPFERAALLMAAELGHFRN
jgi:lipid-A-disaccharide synthase